MKLKLGHRSIFNCLELAAERNELIHTTRKQFKIGKTTALVEFARLNDYTILTSNNGAAKIIHERFGYKKAVTINKKCTDGISNVVIEERCTLEEIDRIKAKGINVVTGFLFDDSVF
ncbi:hypothetical protein [Oceanobacillus oncorhynchi]|uniref:hypothetical protein n=1 Tax=Oceanobacillus oncorhynchi TaxID=545501 RepID=UPI00186603C6|nr:hypothetical protein [Oceanobacillus oncorhynchi]